MKKIFITVLTAAILYSCGPKVNDLATNLPVNASIDLVNVKDDKVKVEVDPGRFTTTSINFYIPKTVPGTYSNNDYGQFIDDFKAFDYDGNLMQSNRVDKNTWQISNAQNLNKVTYWVNDSFDTETQVDEAVFSPAGTNIEANTNYFLNLHMLVGYFNDLDQRPYQISFTHPNGFVASTSLKEVANQKENTDTFYANRYFEVTDNPIMYSKLDSETFTVNDIEVTLSVYSPNGTYKAIDIKEDMERMMKAQKTFLGDVNATKSYHILLYLSTGQENDATGFGALEHHTSTTVVLPESMPKQALIETMIDVVSHEFFHIVTPLSVHSEEVHYFNYNDPAMSKHLWMYEGVTEYFANLFQIQQGLISNEAFYDRINQKIQTAKNYDDNMSFTVMSENILEEPYKGNYVNVYQKGALIGMCIDIIIREQSNGEKGILWLMKQLSDKYGKDKPFDDDTIIDEIVKLTYPEVGDFFNKHVIGDTPINYTAFLNKVGLAFTAKMEETGYLMNGQIPYIDVKPGSKEVFFRNTKLNSFLTDLGIQGGDIIKSINGTAYNLDNIRDMIIGSFGWQPDQDITMVVVREGKEVTLSGKTKTPMAEVTAIVEEANASSDQIALRNAWMKN
ncbi:M61 family metallopeptidase [Zhouia amylolytica]|uniref:Putative protease with the C-terminal PDZ domain protein n=1 Tax=Zhouia amylolytica AD3 TaxID=1286632 RepID=W2US12_9FLAO|nr:peptidase M61 [Zhouia amylolytica]ETN96965.1 putative protease with the C-terminal PDZ domain protein [Zhouia amylolytica AD3]